MYSNKLKIGMLLPTSDYRNIDLNKIEGLIRVDLFKKGEVYHSLYYFDELMQEFTDLKTPTEVSQMDAYKNHLVGEIIYEHVLQNNRLQGLKLTINWYNFNNEIAETKSKLTNFTVEKVEEYLEGKRKRQFAYLKSALPDAYKSHITALYTHYKTQIDIYKETGNTKPLIEAMTTETNERIKQILNAPIEDPKTGVTAKVYQGIIAEIT